MNTIFINFQNSKGSEPHRLLLNLADKIEVVSMLLYQILFFTTHQKILKSHTKIINSKYQLQHGMKILICLMDSILYHIFKIILNIS